MALTLICRETKSLKIGPAVVNPFLRHPSVIASAMATLSEYGGDRCILGIGTGGYELEEELEILPRKPVSILSETVIAIRRLLSGAEVSADREWLKLRKSRLWFVPPYDIPIFIGARGTKTFRLAGRIADGLLTNGVKSEYIDFLVKETRAVQRQQSSQSQICVVAPVVIDTNEARGRTLARNGCVYMAGGAYSTEVLGFHGLNLVSLEPLREAVRKKLSSPAEKVPMEAVDAFCITGNEQQCGERIAEMKKHGVTQIVAIPLGKRLEEKAEAIRGIGRLFRNLRNSV